MLRSPNAQATSHSQVISTLTRLHQERQQTTDGRSLLEAHGNIGLVLADPVNGLKLSTDDQRQILGAELFSEIAEFICDNRQN